MSAKVEAQQAPGDYNIGVNANAAAGQTVAYVHRHVIARDTGDVPDLTEACGTL